MQQCTLSHGEWKKLPPEKIPPKTTIEWASTNKPLSLHGEFWRLSCLILSLKELKEKSSLQITKTKSSFSSTNSSFSSVRTEVINSWHLPHVGSKTSNAKGPSSCKIVSTESSNCKDKDNSSFPDCNVFS